MLILVNILIIQQCNNLHNANSYATADAGAVNDNYIVKYDLYKLKRDLAKANYYSILVDGNTGKNK